MKLERKGNHTYYLDGAKLPGVTTILGAGLPAPALVDWAARITAQWAVDNWDELSTQGPIVRYERMCGARWAVSDAAKLRGTEIHTYADRIVHGEEVSVPGAIRGPVEALADLMDTLEMDPLHTETMLCNVTDRWAGTTDVVATIKGERWLLDYKTGKGLYEKDALQVAAYANATHWLDTAGGGFLLDWVPPERVGLIHVTADSATLHEVDNVADCYAVFRHVQDTAAWLGSLKDAPVIGDAL